MYRAEFSDLLMKHMQQGLSFESFAAVVGVHRDTLYEWVKQNPRFSDTLKMGREASLLHWEKVGMMGMHGKIKGFNAAVYIFNLKNRFGWTDNFDFNGRLKTSTTVKTVTQTEVLKAKQAENQARLDAIKQRK